MARKPEPPKRPSRVTVPEKAHPHAKLVFALMQRLGFTYDEVEWKSGVLRSTLKAWRTNNAPGLETLAAAFGSMGWYYLPIPSTDRLPPNIKAGIDALAAEYGEQEALIGHLMMSVAKAPILKAARPIPEPEPAPVNRAARRSKKRSLHPDQILLFDEGIAA